MKNLKTFQARTMAEAIEKVKRRFGRDAVILHTRSSRSGGLLGFGGHCVIEVTAAPLSQTFRLRAPSSQARVPARSGRRVDGADGTASAMSSAAAISIDQAAPRLLEEVTRLKALVHDLASRARHDAASSLPKPFAAAYVELIQRQVGEDIAAQIVERVRAELGDKADDRPAVIREHLVRYVESMLPVAGPIRLRRGASPTVVCMVGPTGVGKTTTIAKLAANFSLREGKKVGLVTIDTCRIAAVQQLRTFAQILQVPLEVAAEAGELRRTVGRMSDRDLVLIDTPGRSPYDDARLQDLKRFLEEAKPHEVHLVLSTTTRQGVLMDAIERYQVLNVNRVIFTKLDEAIGFGAILTCLARADAKLSYLTTGQEVPDDIRVGQQRMLAHLLVEGSPPAAG